MPGPEDEASQSHSTDREPIEIPGSIQDQSHQVLVQKNDRGVLFVRVAHQEQLVFSATVSVANDVHLLFADGRQVLFPAKQEPPLEELPLPEETTAPAAPERAATGQVEQEKKPMRLVGKVKQPGTLEQTPKQHRPVYRFSLVDEQQRVEHKIVAFDSIAQQLAAPETNLTAEGDMKMLAWRHVNTVHISGQQRQVVEWYPQKIWFGGKVIEKQQSKRPRNQA